MRLHHWFIPTQHNNYRAKLIQTPALAVFMVMLLLVNTVLGTVPIRSLNAAVTIDDLLELHNKERAKEGLGALTYNATLSNSAQHKAEAMIASDCWSHYCPEGKSPWDFFEESGYDYIYAGENLAEGFFNTEDAMVAWMNSTTHRDNILRDKYTEVGFGIARGDFQGIENSLVIAAHFGTPTRAQIATINFPDSNIATPEILTPADGEYLSGSEVVVSGKSAGAERVEIYESGSEWVVTDANQGIFTYNAEGLAEQQYSLTVKSVSGFEQSNESNPVTFTVDRTPDEIKLNDIIVLSKTDDTYAIQINKPTLKSSSFLIGSRVLGLTEAGPGIWEVEVTANALHNSDQVGFNTQDLAGNEWSGDFSSAEILSRTTEPATPESLTNNTILKSQINLAALLLLGVLFGIDFIVLLKSGLTNQAKTHSHHHLALLIIVGLLAVTGSLTAHIGQAGISL